MATPSHEFQGILTLNRNLVDQLYRYLEDREFKACQAILSAVQARFQESNPQLTPSQTSKFSDTVEFVGRKIRQLIQNRQTISGQDDWREVVAKVNKALWGYLEILEGCVTELFQQLDQIGVEEWSIELAHSVDAIKEMLLHRLDDLRWSIRRLEHQFHEYRWAGELNAAKWAVFKKMALFWKRTLDTALSTNLEKCRKYLGFRYQKFSDQYERYIDIHTAIELVVDKFHEYRAFSSLEGENQEKFKKIYRLIRLWELNRQTRALPRRETIRAVRNAMSPEQAYNLFRDYDLQLRRRLFDLSRAIKEHPEELQDKGAINRMQEDLAGYRAEVANLSSTLSTYRDFLLKSDPALRTKPQVGFSEWSLEPEPPQMRHLSSLYEDLKRLDEMMSSFSRALENKGSALEPSLAEADRDIQSVLHEMAQPLISRPTMLSRSDRFVRLLEQLDLLSSSDRRVVPYAGQMLMKGMRTDWQYHVLFENPSFHHIYAIYRGLCGPCDERSHINRLHKFKRLIQQLEQWVKNHDTPRHSHEIELDLNDLKGYLQDFLAYTQRITKEDPQDHEKVAQVAQQLLEYRYLFGNFFHHLQDDSIEERILRKQLLFVDQYFEAVENRLQESGVKSGETA